MNSYAMLQTAADNNALLQCCCACPAPWQSILQAPGSIFQGGICDECIRGTQIRKLSSVTFQRLVSCCDISSGNIWFSSHRKLFL
jgi:hypothetical protein